MVVLFNRPALLLLCPFPSFSNCSPLECCLGCQNPPLPASALRLPRTTTSITFTNGNLGLNNCRQWARICTLNPKDLANTVAISGIASARDPHNLGPEGSAPTAIRSRGVLGTRCPRLAGSPSTKRPEVSWWPLPCADCIPGGFRSIHSRSGAKLLSPVTATI
jgi:hypothetical protein